MFTNIAERFELNRRRNLEGKELESQLNFKQRSKHMLGNNNLQWLSIENRAIVFKFQSYQINWRKDVPEL